MSREDDVYESLADTFITSLYLTGGLFKSGDLGPEGITRETAPAAFDSDGFLKPCALVKQRSTVNTGDLSDIDYKLISKREVVEIYLYQDTGFDTIDNAVNYITMQLTGEQYDDSFEMNLDNIVDRQRDTGALRGASLIRMDWSIVAVGWDPPISI